MAEGDGNRRIGKYVRARRLSLGLSLANAAEASNLDQSYWNRLENGYYQKPDPRLLPAIAETLQVDVADLYALAGYPVPKQLPGFQPYLRAKYDLPPEAIADLERYFDLLRNYYGVPKEQPVFPPKRQKRPKKPEEEIVPPWGKNGAPPWESDEAAS